MPGSKQQRNWSREETILAFNLYCRIPFSKTTQDNDEVRKLAELLGRSPGSVSMKLRNLGHHDPTLREERIQGLRHTSRMDSRVWEEFHEDWEALINESLDLHEQWTHPEGQEATPQVNESLPILEGEDDIRLAKARKRQGFFRETILSAYEGRCCITGLGVPRLLIASHIKPWAECDKKEKLSPQNGLCLNALHDLAFDRGLIAIEDDRSVLIGRELKKAPDSATKELLLRYEGQSIRPPGRFRPEPEFLAWHRDNIFQR